MLIRGLPEDAATWSPDTKGWTIEHELRAQLIEIVDVWGREQVAMLLRLHGDPKKVDGPIKQLTGNPHRVTHPGREEPKKPERKRASREEMERFFARHF